jgi:uncharacterized protein YhfF
MATDPRDARLSEIAHAFWERYLRTLPANHSHRGTRPDVFAFGDSPSLADELAALVQTGRKRATASLPIEFIRRFAASSSGRYQYRDAR